MISFVKKFILNDQTCNAHPHNVYSMIITHLSDGLGNQLFNYAFGRVLSLHHQVPLKTDLYWFKHEVNTAYRTYGMSHFDIQAPEASWQELDEYIFADTKWHRLTTPYYKRVCIREKARRYDPNVWRFPRKTFLTGYWQAWRYYANYHEELRREFRIVTPPSASAARLYDQFRSDSSVAIHIRRGDYLTNQSFNVLPIDYYNTAINYLQERYESLNWYVFSDDPKWAYDNLTSAKNPFIVQGLADIDDFRLMNSTNHSIIANSTFSWWAAWLKPLDGRTIIAPKTPFHDSSLWNADDFLPPHFVRL